MDGRSPSRRLPIDKVHFFNAAPDRPVDRLRRDDLARLRATFDERDAAMIRMGRAMIKSDGIVMTEVRREDSEALYRWINDAETVRFNAPWRPVPWGNHAAWFDALGRDPSTVLLVIRKDHAGPPIGVVQLINIHPIHRLAELRIRIGTEADRSQGLGTVALKAALDFAWRDLNLHRVWLRVFTSNERAIAAYTKAGFQKEGVLRQAAWIDGAWQDEIVMAALHEQGSR